MNKASLCHAKRLLFVVMILFFYTAVVLQAQDSIFTNQTPTGIGDDSDYELGTKFTTSQVANVTKLRFFKAPGETGIHKGKIWNSSGTKLVEVTFTSETASGWQHAELPSTFFIFPGTVYTVSVNTNTKYSYTSAELATTVSNGILSTVGDGNNGVFNETPETFPSSSFNNSNYYVDVEATALNSIFTTELPGGSFNDGPYEMGVKFTTSQAAKLRAISYYKVAGETGSHTGNLWSSTGSLITSVTFTGESASGWQYAILPSTIFLSPGTEYVVSVNSNTEYGAANNSLASSVSNGILSTVVGNNGVFGNQGTFPTSSFQNSNYFRDIIVEPIYVPALPTLISPANGATGISTEPTLTWSSVSGADSYTLELATDAGFSNLIFTQSGLTSTSQSFVGLLNNQEYFWRVSAENFAGSSGFSSASFTTTIERPVYLSYPIGGQTIYTDPITLSWYIGASSAGYKFDVYYSTDPGLGSPSVISDITGTSVVVNGLLRGATYYWQVRSKTLSGAIASYSIIESFKTSGGSVTPTPSYPLNNDIVYSYSPKLYWYTGTSQSGLTYEVEFRQGGAGSLTGNATATGITELSYQLSGLTPDTEYSWQVRSKYATTYSAWSTPVTFKTVQGAAAPVVPILSWPINNALVYSTDVNLYWYLNSSSSGLSFELKFVQGEVAALGGATIITNISAQTYHVSGLQNGARYSWQVRSTDGSSFSNWSTPTTFEVVGGVAVPVVPIPSYPIGGVTIYTENVKLNWFLNSSYAGLTFDIEFGTGALTGTPTVAGLTTGSFEIANLSPGTTYYWSVRSSNGATQSKWSATQSFKTTASGGNSVSIPVLSWPIGGATVYSTSTQLLWYHNEPAVGLTYELQYSINSNMSSAVTVANLTNKFHTVSGLSTGTTYYWRVRSYNGAVYSNYSSITSFVTVASNGWAVPIAAAPSGGLEISSSSPQLSWFIPTDSEISSFEVEFSSSADMSKSSIIQTDLVSKFINVEDLQAGEEYFWRVRSKNADEEASAFSEIASFSISSGVTSVNDEEKVYSFSLEQNFPNPFNPSTTFKFSIPAEGIYTLSIYNILGEKVATLLSSNLSSGVYSVNFDASNLASGMYIYSLTGNNLVLNKKMLLLK